MGITERREREREEIRRKILDAARELFRTEGYDHVTMRRIADAIEYSPTAIYGHFEDKDDLVKCLCEEDFTRLFSVLGTQPPPTDPTEWIRQLGLAYARFAVTYPNHYRFMFMTPAKFEHIHEPASPGEQSFGLLRSAVQQAIARGQFREGDANTIAQVLWSQVHGAVTLLITLQPQHWPCAPAAPDLVEQAIDNSIRGFLRSPSTTASHGGKAH